MAVLTNAEKGALGEAVSSSTGGITLNYTKPIAWLAFQAIEDWFELNRAALGTAINTATAPTVLTVAQKKAFVAFWCRQKFGREGF